MPQELVGHTGLRIGEARLYLDGPKHLDRIGVEILFEIRSFFVGEIGHPQQAVEQPDLSLYRIGRDLLERCLINGHPLTLRHVPYFA